MAAQVGCQGLNELPQVKLRFYITCHYSHNPLRLLCNLIAAGNASSMIIKGPLISIQLIQKAIAECGIKCFVILTANAGWGGGADIFLAIKVPLIAKDEDTIELHSLHLLDVFFVGGGHCIKIAGIRSSKIRLLFEIPATCKGIDPNWVALEELRGHKS